MKSKVLALALGLAMAVSAQAASASTVLATYYKVTPGGDFQKTCCSTSIEVAAMLGPNGLPVYVSGENVLEKDVMTNEILWWTPKAPHIVKEGSLVKNLPFNDATVFTPFGTGANNSNSFQTIRMKAFFNTVGNNTVVNFNFRSDDDLFLFIDGKYVDSNLDGIHAPRTANYFTNVGAGYHTFDLFYADRHTTQAELHVTVGNATLTAVPEPGTWALMIMGFGGAGAMIRRRRSLAAAT